MPDSSAAEAAVAGKATPGTGDTVEGPAAERVEELQDENAQLQEAVRSHAVVDQAIGVVIALGRLTPDQGWRVLREISQRTNVKLRDVARLLIDWARTGRLDDGIRTELEQQLGRVRSARDHA
ncbi:ANTAR domain-containing protein [Streptomyces sp. MMBL 11-3]|uniref:ANTAR domain-containing protein n=1 Tax=Streptomyces sp. MMBL 11-3 TaxID=3382639 RepID=UPI0039B4D6FD